MTQQDDITQPMLTDDELMALLPGAVRLPPGWIDTARAIESALLSKLRAEGVPVAEPTHEMYAAAQRVQLQYGDEPLILNTSQIRAVWQAMQGAAPVASAPADERAAFEAAWCQMNSPIPLNTRRHDDGRYATPDIEREWRLWQARAALASAPVAGEAQRVFLVPTGEVYCGQETYTRHEGQPPVNTDNECLYTAPQASEAVRNADVSALLSFIFGRFGQPGDAGELPDTVAAAVRRLERAMRPQADKDGGQQHEGVVTDDMRYAVRFAPSSAHWSERLMEFFGPDAREGIDALEKQLREARAALSATQTEQGERDA